eukprot:g6936.t1
MLTLAAWVTVGSDSAGNDNPFALDDDGGRGVVNPNVRPVVYNPSLPIVFGGGAATTTAEPAMSERQFFGIKGLKSPYEKKARKDWGRYAETTMTVQRLPDYLPTCRVGQEPDRLYGAKGHYVPRCKASGRWTSKAGAVKCDHALILRRFNAVLKVKRAVLPSLSVQVMRLLEAAVATSTVIQMLHSPTFYKEVSEALLTWEVEYGILSARQAKRAQAGEMAIEGRFIDMANKEGAKHGTSMLIMGVFISVAAGTLVGFAFRPSPSP